MDTLRPTRRRGGFTLVELLIVVAVLAVILVLAAPSFTKMIQMQRLKSINAQLVTDMQFARAEAVMRRDRIRIAFRSNSAMSCYTIYTTADRTRICDCRLGVGSACSTDASEIRTVQVTEEGGVQVKPPATGFQEFAFDPRTGGLYAIPTDNDPRPIDMFKIDVFIDTPRKLQTRINASGRPLVCAPADSTMNEVPCT